MNLIKKMIIEKREYKEQMTRVKALPEEYRFVFEKLQELITLFEESAVQGIHVLEVTGKDVADFCNEFLTDSKKWTDKYRKKLNREVGNISL